MKSILLCVTIVMVCAGLVSPADSRQSEKRTILSSDALPAEMCAAIENYIAKVNTARSFADKAERQKKYKEAKAQLEPVLLRYNKASLLAEALSFASYSEQVAATDATDPKLPGLLDQRARSRQKLLGSCPGYSTVP